MTNRKQTYTLQVAFEGGVKVYYLKDSDGKVVAHGPASKQLAKLAFNEGADEVRHDFDLAHAKDET